MYISLYNLTCALYNNVYLLYNDNNMSYNNMYLLYINNDMLYNNIYLLYNDNDMIYNKIKYSIFLFKETKTKAKDAPSRKA